MVFPDSRPEGTNQAGKPPERNLFTTDPLLQKAMSDADCAGSLPLLTAFGEIMGMESTACLAEQANRFVPCLYRYDATGARIDEVHYHPAYHQLMDLAIGHGIHSVAWTSEQCGHRVHTALEYLFAQVEGGVCCPVTMTYAAYPVLKQAGSDTADWASLLLSNRYDARFCPVGEKSGITVGMAMTEKQGGSDLRATTTVAKPIEQDIYRLNGHKWFCSAPMSDGFLTLARTGEGVSCFLVPRWQPDGSRNPFHIERLKEKLGNRSNASSEIEYLDTLGFLVGEPGRGIATIMTMVKHTRLDTCLAPVAMMRQSLAYAVHNARYRKAFGKRLIEQPLMINVLSDMAVELEASVALLFEIAGSFDEAGEQESEEFSRLAASLGKFHLNKMAPGFICEAMELLGGNGYVEDFPLARFYREAPLNGIWEGSGNVICLDVMRTLGKFPSTFKAFLTRVEPAVSRFPGAAELSQELEFRLTGGNANSGVEAGARNVVEAMARLWQCALLVEGCDSSIADYFFASRLQNGRGSIYGAAHSMNDPAYVASMFPEI